MRRPGVLAVLTVFVAGCTNTVGGEGLASAAGPDLSSLTITGATPVPLAAPVQLSPDGERLLTMGGEVCVTLLDGSAERCVGRERVVSDARFVRWSPDSTEIVLTEDFFRQFHEPDVWVFDVITGDLRNVTDDGIDDVDIADESSGARLDVLPSWSADGRTIRFARGAAGSDQAELVTIPADGGEPERVRNIECGVFELSALVWSADRVAWTCGIDRPTVWLAEHESGGIDRVLSGDGGARQDRMLLSFSPDGRWLLVDSVNPYLEGGSDAGRLARAVPVGGGSPVPVADGSAAYPTWSPGGHALAYVELPGTVKVVPSPGGEPRVLHRARAVAAADGLRLNWAHGRLLTLTGGDPTLLALVQ